MLIDISQCFAAGFNDTRIDGSAVLTRCWQRQKSHVSLR